jgi:hypothetical protein
MLDQSFLLRSKHTGSGFYRSPRSLSSYPVTFTNSENTQFLILFWEST